MSLHYFPYQRRCIETLLSILDRLPRDARWAFTVTDEDNWESNAVLNVFVPLGMSLEECVHKYWMGEPFDKTTTFMSYQVGPLVVSFIKEEE